jgi:hypothetical protein
MDKKLNQGAGKMKKEKTRTMEAHMEFSTQVGVNNKLIADTIKSLEDDIKNNVLPAEQAQLVINDLKNQNFTGRAKVAIVQLLLLNAGFSVCPGDTPEKCVFLAYKEHYEDMNEQYTIQIFEPGQITAAFFTGTIPEIRKKLISKNALNGDEFDHLNSIAQLRNGLNHGWRIEVKS